MKIKTITSLALLSMATHTAIAAESVLEAPGPQGPLRGALLQPDTQSDRSQSLPPVVLIIPGSGPTDRDGNNRLGVKAATYRLMAEALASKGIATLRIDKRGMFSSAAAIPDGNKVSIEGYADDVHAWVKEAQARTGAPCVWVLGHSEGGLVATVAAQQPQGICGLVLVATGGRPLGDILLEQFRKAPDTGTLHKDADTTIALLKQGKTVDVSAMHPAVRATFAPQVQAYLISTMKLSPTELLARYQGPTLVLQGDKDIQVDVEDARALAAAHAGAKLVILPGVSHTMKIVNGDTRAANVATYTDPALPISDAVVNAVADFVRTEGR